MAQTAISYLANGVMTRANHNIYTMEVRHAPVWRSNSPVFPDDDDAEDDAEDKYEDPEEAWSSTLSSEGRADRRSVTPAHRSGRRGRFAAQDGEDPWREDPTSQPGAARIEGERARGTEIVGRGGRPLARVLLRREVCASGHVAVTQVRV